MVNFEDGTLIKGAYVVIDGKEYDVHMPQYSGDTPLSSENLNKMQTDLQEEIEITKGTILYEGETGTLGNVPLNDDATNYKYIEVFGHRSDRNLYTKVRTNKPYFDLNHVRYANNGFYFYAKEYSINGSMLNVEYSKFTYTDSAIQEETETYITKVVGYK